MSSNSIYSLPLRPSQVQLREGKLMTLRTRVYVCVCVCSTVRRESGTFSPRPRHSSTTFVELCANWSWMSQRSESGCYFTLLTTWSRKRKVWKKKRIITHVRVLSGKIFSLVVKAVEKIGFNVMELRGTDAALHSSLPRLPLKFTPLSCCISVPQLSDSDVQEFHDRFRPRMNEMLAFNMVSVLFKSRLINEIT